MKKTFTPELISNIVNVAARLVSSISEKDGGKVKEEVDGVTLTVSVAKSNQQGFMMGDRRTASVAFGRMIIVYGLDVCLFNTNIPNNALRVILSAGLGANHNRVDMAQLTKMIIQQNAVHTMNSGPGNRFSSVMKPADFEIELPGGVVFSRTDKTLSVVKGEENLYVLSSTIPSVIEQHMAQAANLAIMYADDIPYPARTVDTSIDSALLNGVLYVKSEDKKVAYYFDDERNKAFVARQSGQHFGHGVIHDPNQQYSHPFNNLQSGFSQY